MPAANSPADSDTALPRQARQLRAACFVVAVLALALGAGADMAAPTGERVVHVERSPWQTIVVADSATRRCLRFGESADALNQSCRLLAKPDHLALDYTRAMAAMLLLWQPAPTRVLLIGVGGGSLPMALALARPQMEIDAVDIDPAVLRTAERYFGLRAGPRLRLHAADGAAFVAEARARGHRYDAVLLDAFDEQGIPPALFSSAFLRDVRALLEEHGVVLANTFTDVPSHAAEAATAESVLGPLLDVRVSDAGGNRLLIAAASQAHARAPAELLAQLPTQRASLARIGISESWVTQLRFARSGRQPAPAR